MLERYRNRISTRLVINIVLIHAILMGFIVIDMIERESDFTRGQLIEKGKELAELLASNTASSLLNNDIIAMKERISQLNRFGNLQMSFIIDSKNRVRASNPEKYFNLVLEDGISSALKRALDQSSAVTLQKIHNSQIDTVSKIVVNGQAIGYTRIIMDMSNYEKEIQIITRHGIYYVLIAILAGALLAWLSVKRMTRKFTLLTEVANKMAKKEFDTPLPESGAADEIDTMTRAMKSMQEALHEHLEYQETQRQLLRNIINNIPARVFWKDTDSRYLGCNNLFLKDASLQNESEIIGKSDYDMVWKEQADLYRTDDATVMRTGSSRINFKEPQTQADGSQIWLMTSKVPLYNDQYEVYGILGIYLDITEEVNAQKKANEQEMLIIQQSKLVAMGEMISMIAHQWRQPLTVIMTVANTVKVKAMLEELPYEQAIESMETIEKSTEHLSKTIDDFRHFYKTASKMQWVRIRETIEHTIGMIKDIYYANGHIAIEVSYSEGTETMELFSNESLIQQVLLNLLSNARDAILSRTPEDPKIMLGVSSDETSIHISVEDNGGGIEEKLMDKVFEPYFSTKSLNGTGLGLHIVKTIVEKQLEGSVKLVNVKGGAQFTISLPRNRKPEAEGQEKGA